MSLNWNRNKKSQSKKEPKTKWNDQSKQPDISISNFENAEQLQKEKKEKIHRACVWIYYTLTQYQIRYEDVIINNFGIDNGMQFACGF